MKKLFPFLLVPVIVSTTIGQSFTSGCSNIFLNVSPFSSKFSNIEKYLEFSLLDDIPVHKKILTGYYLINVYDKFNQFSLVREGF